VVELAEVEHRRGSRLLRLDPIADLDALQRDTSALARRIENLRLADWGLWRRDGEASAAAARPTGGHLDGQRWFTVVDTGSLATPSERTAIDEAHNVLPAVTDDRCSNRQSSSAF